MQEALGYDYNYFGWWWIEDEAGMNQRLRDAYDEYNAEHPDDPLPFEQFPVIWEKDYSMIHKIEKQWKD